MKKPVDWASLNPAFAGATFVKDAEVCRGCLPPNHQFAFSSPPTIEEDLQVVNLRFEIPVKTVTLILGYSYESYSLADWQQGSGFPWVESVGGDTLLRDTSRSYQWGNRLFNLGTYIAPGYEAHIGFVGFSYRF